MSSLDKIYDLLHQKFTENRGKSYYFVFQLTQGDDVKKLDLVEYRNSRLPSGQTANIPGEPVSNILIINSGANTLHYATNRDTNDYTADIPLSPNSHKEIKLDLPCFKSINFYSSLGTTIEIIVFV